MYAWVTMHVSDLVRFIVNGCSSMDQLNNKLDPYNYIVWSYVGNMGYILVFQGGSRLVLSIHIDQVLFLPTTNWLTNISSNADISTAGLQSSSGQNINMLIFCPDVDVLP